MIRRALFLTILASLAFGCTLDTTRQADIYGREESLGVEVARVLCQRYISGAVDDENRRDVMGLRWRDVCLTGEGVPEDAPSDLYGFLLHRDRLVQAVDAVLPPEMQDPLAALLGKLMPIYDPPAELLPQTNRATAQVVATILQRCGAEDVSDRSDCDPAAPGMNPALRGIYRIAQREGYRPLDTQLGAIRPTLLYSDFDELARLGLRVVSEQTPEHPERGAASDEYREVLRALALELAYLEPEDLEPGEESTAELLRSLLLGETDPEFVGSTGAFWVLGRDRRGLVNPNGPVVAPFVDADMDGRPDVDPTTGRFLSATGGTLDMPPFRLRDEDEPLPPNMRDEQGRATDGNGNLIYEYINADETMLSALVREGKKLFVMPPSPAFQVARALPALMGPETPGLTDTFGFNDQPTARLTFTGSDPARSPLLDFIYAGIELLPREGTARVLELTEELVKAEHEQYLAAVGATVEMMLRHKPMYPDSNVRDSVTLYDDLLMVLEQFAAQPGLIEELLRSQLEPASVIAGEVLSTQMRMRDNDLDYNPGDYTPDTYDANGLRQGGSTPLPDRPYNQAPLNATLADLTEPVDRTMPDIEGNESVFQRVLSLIDGFNEARLCNKEGAVIDAPVNIAGIGTAIKLHLPVSNPPMQNGRVVCENLALWVAGLSGTAPDNTKTAPACSLVDIPNVTEAFTQTIVGTYEFRLADPLSQEVIDCLAEDGALFAGPDVVDESFALTFGLAGMGRFPTPQAFARMLFWGLRNRDGSPVSTNPSGTPNCQACLDLFGPVVTDKYGNDVVTRYGGTVYAMETPGFYEGMRPLLSVLHRDEYRRNADGEYLFGNLMSTLYRHWGSSQNWRQVNQAGESENLVNNDIRSYEPPIAEALGTGETDGHLMERLFALNTDVAALLFTGDDNVTRDGLQVLADAAVDLVWAGAPVNEGLTTRQGGTIIQSSGREFGVSPIRLFFQGSAGMDDALNTDPADRAEYFAGRDEIASIYWSTELDETTGQYRLKNRREVAIIRHLVPFLRNEYEKHRQRGDLQEWSDELYSDAEDLLASALGSAVVRFLDAAYSDREASDALVNFLGYLMDDTNRETEPFVGLVTDISDILSVIDDSDNLMPLAHVASEAIALNARGATDGNQLDIQNSVAGRGLDLINEIEDNDDEKTLHDILRNLMARPSDEDTYLVILMEIMNDINRVDPSSNADLNLDDYSSILWNVHDFMVDCDRGLERLFRVLQRRDLTLVYNADQSELSPCEQQQQ